MISVDTKSLSDYKKKLRKLQRGVPYAMMKVLNDSAFGTRETAINNISMSMILRSGPFIKSTIRVTKATKSVLVSQVGSIKRDRYSGLLEQETGSVAKGKLGKRAVTKEARGGTFTSKMKPGARLQTTKTIEEVNNFNELKKFERIKYKKPFRIVHYTGKTKISPGLYMFKGRKKELKLLQTFVHPTKAKRHEWMKDAHKKYYSKHPLPRLWKEHLSRAIRDSKKK